MVTDWRTLPWIVRSDEAARMSAHAHADAFEDAPRRLGSIDPTRSNPGGVVEHGWRIDPTIMKSDEFLTITVEDDHGLAHFDLSGRYDGVDHDATIRCSIDLLKPSIDDAKALLAIAVRMLRTAADADASECALPHMDRLDAVRAAVLMGLDWDASFEVVQWASSPLATARFEISSPTGRCGMPDPRPDRPVATRLRVMMAGGVWLGPEQTSLECDGFDPMETLRIHRELETTP